MSYFWKGFRERRLNTRTITDLPTLVDTLLADFRTIRIPAGTLPARPGPDKKHWLATAKVNLAER